MPALPDAVAFMVSVLVSPASGSRRGAAVPVREFATERVNAAAEADADRGVEAQQVVQGRGRCTPKGTLVSAPAESSRAPEPLPTTNSSGATGRPSRS